MSHDARPPGAGAGAEPEARHVAAVLDAVHAAASHPGPSCGSVLVVAIDGPAGSGKTTLASQVAERLGAPLVHMDSLYPGWDGLAAAPDLLTRQVLQPLERGEPAAYRRWDWRAGGWGETTTVPVVDVLAVEGCGASVSPAGRYAAVRVWLDAPPQLRRRRGLSRDDDGAAFAEHWDRWARQEQEVFGADGTEQRAHVRLWTADPGDDGGGVVDAPRRP